MAQCFFVSGSRQLNSSSGRTRHFSNSQGLDGFVAVLCEDDISREAEEGLLTIPQHSVTMAVRIIAVDSLTGTPKVRMSETPCLR